MGALFGECNAPCTPTTISLDFESWRIVADTKMFFVPSQLTILKSLTLNMFYCQTNRDNGSSLRSQKSLFLLTHLSYILNVLLTSVEDGTYYTIPSYVSPSLHSSTLPRITMFALTKFHEMEFGS